ncbi:hypothetical protein BU24DRAFT_337939 [Aaosphaeria arxii CBS 175.79]|uniref:AGC-kinase C-terminal domain-containing protein n=1 Tax=Aaosphaeria arxii CBS 175.79 TaxID=1450172 RepID=A0A6A5Y4M1_9PLEO|nr:uncharacterized protein BU24DRAFT_337939 [Aaosphaeria arxii CBS 175.79]KAF2020525.1 hypothetical protein BU24DRAFT_337939 [Aaosphaeria arxii CBS 175.79]
MAPSNVFSYLRPGHGKRNASGSSTIASPDPAVADITSPNFAPPSVQSPEYFTSPRIPDNASFASASPVSPYPPQLPPIPRVASRVKKNGPRPSLASPQYSHGSTGAVSSPVVEERSFLSPTQLRREQLSPGLESLRPSSRSTNASSITGLRSPGQKTPPASSSSFLSPTNMSYSTNSRSQTSLGSGTSDKLSNNQMATPPPTAPAGRSTKSRLNIRNPMSLLMRRRSGPALDPLSDEAIVTHRNPSTIVPPMSDNYDPSIRGRIVHDFSAPRQNRNFSHNNAYGGSDQAQVDNGVEYGRQSPAKVEREHTPVFREHFDDDTSYEQSQAAIRAEQLANKGFIARNSWQPPPERNSWNSPSAKSPPPPPPLPKDSPPPPPRQQPQSPPPVIQETAVEFESSILSPVMETPTMADAPTEISPRKRKSTKTPPPARSRAPSLSDPSFIPAGLPNHLTSRASRFSFQIAGTDNSQEKELEDRHKQKAAEKASKEIRMSTNSMDDAYDDYEDMDDFDMDGGYEEEIPMLGDDDGYGDPTMAPGMGGFDFSSLSINANNPMSPLGMAGEPQTPYDANGNVIGFALSESMTQNMHIPGVGYNLNQINAPADAVHGLGIVDAHRGLEAEANDESPDDTSAAASNMLGYEDDLGDDMYFDDGMIEEQGDMDAGEFDENVFDDPTGPLFDRKVKSPTEEQLLDNAALSSQLPAEASLDAGYEADDDLTRQINKSEPSLAHKTSMAHQRPTVDFSNINTYHSALADAANRAEAEGRFARKPSIDSAHPPSEMDDASSQSGSRPSLIPDDGRFSQETAGFPHDDDLYGVSSGFMDDYDYSDYDSTLEDDPMIAAANAEALANDYEGFYGQEFGFYANAQGDTMNTYGGFFGSSGLGRSVSGRNAVREPNLTPITERSEYSTRNSFISLNHFRDSQQPIQSPGLAQLARMSPYGWREEEPDMSLDSLMKLRKGTFGGSTASLGGTPSSTGNSPRNSSPMGMQFLPRTSSPLPNNTVSHPDSSEVPESDDSGGIDDGYDDDVLDAINDMSGEYSDEEDDPNMTKPESPTLTAKECSSLSSLPLSSDRDDIPPLPQILPLHPHAPRMAVSSPLANVPLQSSPPTMPLPSPPLPLNVHTGHQSASTYSPSDPQSIDLSLPSPLASASAQHRGSFGLISPISTTSPMTPGGSTGWKAGHSRKGSDSVTYVREHDELGGDRWVLERRRTAESGELELIGREIVEGGRI